MKKNQNSYKKSGVNIFSKQFSKIYLIGIKKIVKKKGSYSFKEEIGGFGSLFDISGYKIKDPVIVSCTDGVGTKIELAVKYKNLTQLELIWSLCASMI